MIFCPYALFRQKNRLFPAFIGFLRLFARFCLFCSFFLTIGLLTPFWRIFLRYRSVLRFYPLLPIFSVFFALFWRFYRVSPYLSRIQQVFELTCALLRKYRTFRSNKRLFLRFLHTVPAFPRFRGIVARSQPFTAFYPQFTLLYRFSDNSPVFALYCAFFCKEKDGTSVPPAFYAICAFSYSRRRLSRLLV